MIQPDHKIQKWVEQSGIDCYDLANINPASIDLTLGDTLIKPKWFWSWPTKFLAWYILGKPDPRKRPDLYWSKPIEFDRFTLWPGQFVLCYSLEAVDIPDNMCALLISKSTTGRIGLEHLHAGFGDPGFGKDKKAQWTWELKNLAPWPIELVAGQRLMQMILIKMDGIPERNYDQTGRYQGQRGPTAARIQKDEKITR